MLVYSANEFLQQAAILAPQVRSRAHLIQYRQLLTAGIATLEALLADAYCPQHIQVYTCYILAQVLYSETECLDRVVTLLTQGMTIAQRCGLSDLVLQMECLNVRALCVTNRKAALFYCNRGAEKYNAMVNNYAFHTFQLLHFDLMLDNSLPQAFALSHTWQALPDSIPKSFLIMYGFAKAVEYNVGNYDETLATLWYLKEYGENVDIMNHFPQMAILNSMLSLTVVLRRDAVDPVTEAGKELEGVLNELNSKAQAKGELFWEKWNVDGSIRVQGAHGSTFNVQWITQFQCLQQCYFLLALAALRRPESTVYGRGLLKECLELMENDEQDQTKQHLNSATLSQIADYSYKRRKLKATVLLYLTLVNFCNLAYKKGRRSFERFVTLSSELEETDQEDLSQLSTFVAALAAQTGGKPKRALRHYRNIDRDGILYSSAIANMCCIDPSPGNIDLLKHAVSTLSPEHHVLKHATVELVRLVQDTTMSPLDRLESIRKVQKGIHQSMTLQISYASTLICLETFGSTAEKNIALGGALKTAVNETDLVWAYVIGEKNKELLHQLGQQDQLDTLTTNLAKIEKHVLR